LHEKCDVSLCRLLAGGFFFLHVERRETEEHR
jgi:hypothetical protein